MTNISYVGFWRRLLAFLIDGAIIYPVWTFIIPMLIVYSSWFTIFVTYALANLLFIGYRIVLVTKYGGTPGKLILKIKVVDESGNNISIYHSLLRETFIIISTVTTLIFLYNVISDLQVYELPKSFGEISMMIGTKNVGLYSNITGIIGLIFIFDGLFLIFNKKKRALHDYLAKSLVVRDNR